MRHYSVKLQGGGSGGDHFTETFICTLSENGNFILHGKKRIL